MKKKTELKELTQKQKEIIQQTIVQTIGLKFEEDGASDEEIVKIFPDLIKIVDSIMIEVDKSFIEKITQEMILNKK